MDMHRVNGRTLRFSEAIDSEGFYFRMETRARGFRAVCLELYINENLDIEEREKNWESRGN